MNIVFIHRGGPSMASYRYRAQIPANELGAGVNAGEADVAVFAKPNRLDVDLAKQLKGDGVKVVVDFCDSHFDREEYRGMANLADRVTCSSALLRDQLHGMGYDATVINDPYEYWGEPHANGEKWLWFGHESNVRDVVPYLLKGLPIDVVTGPTNKLIGYTAWSVENLKNALAASNIVFIPDGKATRSNNRMVNAIAAGCFVVGGEQLAEYRKFVWAGSVAHGYKWVRAFQDDLNDLVKVGQEWVKAHHSPKVVADQWRAVCDSI